MPLLMLGTRNRKKRDEIVAILGDLPLEFGDLNDRPDVPEVEETGSTFEENGTLKAVAVARATGAWTLGEDSGLVVPGLNDRPGVYSARYGGKQGDDEANNDRLLAELAPLPADRRAAYYVCVAVLADPRGNVAATSEGRCHGVIVPARRGTNGFGYDPLFLVPEFHKTFGELSPRVKHALSHRARALERMRPAIRRWLGG
jgi:XTP/dITP diphosphohydrolase